ncbi:MAG: hypothetical protein ACRDTE_31070 [Pseudonocardiaceae bacterium]
MRVAAAQVPGVDDSDDRIFTTANATIMLDGASAFVPVQVSAATYAEHLGQVLRAQLTAQPSAELPDVLATAIETTVRSLDLSPGQSPSSTVAIARAHGGQVDLLTLGDTQIVIPRETISDARQATIAIAQRQKYRTRLASGAGYDDDHRALLRDLQTEQAQQRNRDGGYWIAEARPDAAHHAITTQRPIAAAPWAILATDGAYTLMEHLGLADWPQLARANSAHLATILRHCHDWEDQTDPSGNQLPRAKRHDDKSLAAVTFSTEDPATPTG